MPIFTDLQTALARRGAHSTRSATTTPGGPLAYAALIAVAGWLAFLGLALSVRNHGAPYPAEAAVMAYLHGNRLPVVDTMLKLATYLAHCQVYLAAALPFAVLFAWRRQWWWLMALAVTLAGRQTLINVLKPLIGRARPDLEGALMHAAGSSFPSGHALVGTTIYALLACYVASSLRRPWLRAAVMAGAVILAVAIAASRVYLGVHWPLDVLASLLLGPAFLATVFAAMLILNRLWPIEDKPRALKPGFVVAGLAIWIGAASLFALTRPATGEGGGPPEADQSRLHL